MGVQKIEEKILYLRRDAFVNDPLLNFCKLPRSLLCVKSICISSFSCPYFSAFGLNAVGYSVFGKIRTRKSPNTNTFYAVLPYLGICSQPLSIFRYCVCAIRSHPKNKE